jgi:hypothetical protein
MADTAPELQPDLLAPLSGCASVEQLTPEMLAAAGR